MTGEPAEEEHDAESPDLDAIGDHHMPEDLRREQREKKSSQADDTEGERS